MKYEKPYWELLETEDDIITDSPGGLIDNVTEEEDSYDDYENIFK